MPASEQPFGRAGGSWGDMLDVHSNVWQCQVQRWVPAQGHMQGLKCRAQVRGLLEGTCNTCMHKATP